MVCFRHAWTTSSTVMAIYGYVILPNYLSFVWPISFNIYAQSHAHTHVYMGQPKTNLSTYIAFRRRAYSWISTKKISHSLDRWIDRCRLCMGAYVESHAPCKDWAASNNSFTYTCNYMRCYDMHVVFICIHALFKYAWPCSTKTTTTDIMVYLLHTVSNRYHAWAYNLTDLYRLIDVYRWRPSCAWLTRQNDNWTDERNHAPTHRNGFLRIILLL